MNKYICMLLVSSSSLLYGAAGPSMGAHEAHTLYTQISEAFNINKSIQKGIDDRRLADIKKQLQNVRKFLKSANPDPVFEKNTLVPLDQVQAFLEKKIPSYHNRYRLTQMIDKAESLSDMVTTLGQEKNGPQVLSSSLQDLFAHDARFANKLIKSLSKSGVAGDYQILAELLGQSGKELGDKAKADALVAAAQKGLDHPTAQLVVKMILLSKDAVQATLLESIRHELFGKKGEEQLTVFQQHKATLARIIKDVLAKARKNEENYPQAWTDTIQLTAWGILSKAESSLFDEFQKLQRSKNPEFPEGVDVTRPEDLEALIKKSNLSSDKDIKHFISQLERYKYQMKYYRPKSNVLLGFTRLTGAARYADHIETSETLIKHLRSLYPTVMSDLDDQLLLRTDIGASDLVLRIWAQAYEGVMNGLETEINDLMRTHLKASAGKLMLDDDNGFEVL